MIQITLGFVDDRRNRETRREEHSWEGREASVDQERQYMHHGQHAHPHKEWETEEYGEWNRQDRHWQHREPQHQVPHKFKPFICATTLNSYYCLLLVPPANASWSLSGQSSPSNLQPPTSQLNIVIYTKVAA